METPGDYGSLEEYFRHYRNPQLTPGLLRVSSAPDQSPNVSWMVIKSHDLYLWSCDLFM